MVANNPNNIPVKFNAKPYESKYCSIVGLDIGVQTVLYDLAPKTEEKIKEYNCEVYILQRALNRSRHQMNKDNYNSDLRSWEQWNVVYKISRFGSKVIVEDINFKLLSMCSKIIEKNLKTGKIKSTKRFGLSIGNKVPAAFLQKLEYVMTKKDSVVEKLDQKQIKASQLLSDGSYEKLKLSERWRIINGKRVQCDLYSVFLLCVKVDLNMVQNMWSIFKSDIKLFVL